ncbi:Pex13 protein [Colletotrichum fioriniae PJ7]|uniref:Peroxisomal membrane protein PEX13 n=1 Tax=Colletotrichum fioriniae PJ7 TaxID=1445577 RepID=A0A010RS89_9PEZI|nr:Pex13 protein [Colletotrichum fioriniae PJ7]
MATGGTTNFPKVQDASAQGRVCGTAAAKNEGCEAQAAHVGTNVKDTEARMEATGRKPPPKGQSLQFPLLITSLPTAKHEPPGHLPAASALSTVTTSPSAAAPIITQVHCAASPTCFRHPGDPPAFSYPWAVPESIFPSPLYNTSQNVVGILIFTASPIEVDFTPMSAASIATPTPATSLSGGTPPAVPERPASLASAVDQNAAAYSRAGLGAAASPYGSYGGGAYSSPYSSPYSRMGSYGGYGGGMYGGGMYGGGYGGGMYGGGMYGGGMGMGGMGGMGGPNDPNSLTNRFNNSTQATFQMLEGVVGAFGGFAQMLESTYMATHSSFFAMVSVAEQFSNLRDTLGSILGIFTLMRWIRTLIAKITGRPPPADATALTPAAFAKFEGRSPIGPDGAPLGPPKASRKPLFFFLLAAFGLPYLMRKMINTMAASAEEEERRRMALAGAQQPLDPSKLDYCRLLYDYALQPGNAVKDVDMEVRKGDLVAVLSKSDPIGNPSEWWKCRARDGRTGYLPSTYLEVIKRPGQPLAAIKGAPSDSSRTNSLTGAAPEKGPEIKTKIGDVSPESFQKSVFYN